MELMEKGVGLKKTKMGPGAKQEVSANLSTGELVSLIHVSPFAQAYIVGRSNAQKFGICLLVVSFICIIVGLSLKSVSLALRRTLYLAITRFSVLSTGYLVPTDAHGTPA
jgi:hypothetical protein